MKNITIPETDEQADLVYKTVGKREILLTFLPPEKKLYDKAPLYFIISGGGWHSESKDSMLGFSKISVDKLREYGYAVVSIDYRVVTEPDIVMRDIVTDCFDALRYVAYYADVLGIDKYNIITSGHSAGAHLALMLAYAPETEFRCDTSLNTDFKITATIPLSPITVLHNDGFPKTHNLGDIADCFRGCDTVEERKAVSPMTYVSKYCPASLLCAGGSDDLVLCNSSEILYEELKKCGAAAKIVISHNGGHCFEPIGDVLGSYPNGFEIQDILTDFVLEHTKPQAD